MKNVAFSLVLVICAGIFLNSGDLFGQRPEFDTDAWVEKQHREQFSDVTDGKYDQVIVDLENVLRMNPNDQEALFILAAAYAGKGDLRNALSYVRLSLGAGLPVERYLAGPRDILEPLMNSSEFQALIKTEASRLIHGPMLGDVTDQSARIWVRTGEEVPVRVLISQNHRMSDSERSQVVRTSAEQDYTGILVLSGLKPSQRYYYQLMVDGKTLPEEYSFTTFPEKKSPASFRVGFGGGAAYEPQFERMWRTIASHRLPAFLMLGDNVYIDNPTRPAVQRYCYYRRQSSSAYRAFIPETAMYAIWDDHDFVTNDAWGGPDKYEPEWKMPVWQVFKENWNNPYYAGGKDQPGCWFDFRIGDVHFIMLDGRYYRTDPDMENPEMLGPAQKKWLFQTLKESDATFTVLASPVPWAYGAKPGSQDPWQGYKEERAEIFDFLHENRIEGVLLISADRHRSDLWKIDRGDAYPLYEFESSRLTNIHLHGIMEGSIFGYNEKCSFGLLEFNTRVDDPEVTYRIMNIDNEEVYRKTVRRSMLSY